MHDSESMQFNFTPAVPMAGAVPADLTFRTAWTPGMVVNQFWPITLLTLNLKGPPASALVANEFAGAAPGPDNLWSHKAKANWTWRVRDMVVETVPGPADVSFLQSKN